MLEAGVQPYLQALLSSPLLSAPIASLLKNTRKKVGEKCEQREPLID